METSIKKLKNDLTILKLTCPMRGNQPILTHVAFTGSDLVTTDLDAMTIVHNALQGGLLDTTIPLTHLENFTKTTKKDMVKFSEGVEPLSVKAESGKFALTMPGLSREDFPSVPTLPTDNIVNFPMAEWLQAINNVAVSYAKHESYNVLSAISITFEDQYVEFCTTDGSRLTRQRVNPKGLKDAQLLLSAEIVTKFTSKVKGESEMIVSWNNNKNANTHISLQAGDYRLIVRHYEGQYPRYNQLIPNKNTIKVTLSKAEFIESLKQLSPFVNARTNILRMHFNPSGTLNMLAQAPDAPVAENTIPFSGILDESLKINFNIQYLIEGLNNIPGDIVRISTNGSLYPTLLESLDNADYTYLIMPIQVK